LPEIVQRGGVCRGNMQGAKHAESYACKSNQGETRLLSLKKQQGGNKQ